MLKHVRNFPPIKVTFNFTPSLLLEIEKYKTGKGTDRQFLLFKKNAEELTEGEKIEILRDFFLANWQEMVKPYPRYFSMLLKRGKNIVDEELVSIVRTFQSDEIRDIQIWANLSWIDPIFRHEIGDLYQKGRNFSEADKERIITLQNKIISSIFDEYKKAWESGQIELSTSPLYHPIMPLLIDSNLAKVSNPNLVIPFEFSHADDARQQLIAGINVFERIFGNKPKGIWPPEGSVCEELMPMISSLGIDWIATDEEILARSINASFRRDENGVPNQSELLYQPWIFKDVKIVFRDRTLSDLIGFEYEGWDQKNAALDLITRIKHIRNSLSPSGRYMIPIILDGENAWEHYSNDGSEFLENLYGNLVQENIKTTTITNFFKENQVKNTMPTVFPGSWIGANFNIWIGHPEDHSAWLIVQRLRNRLVQKNITDKEIWDRFYAMEGSDWFWWFGDEHYSNVAEVFDELFRMNAVWIYRRIGEEAPAELFSPIKKTTEAFSHQPIDKFTPAIDGQITDFYEWYNAGHADIRRMGGTMHRFAGLFSLIFCGFDDNNLYIRFNVENHDIATYEYDIKFFEPRTLDIVLGETKDIIYKIDQICEVAIPISLIDITDKENVEFIISARQKGVETDRTPLLRFSVQLRDVRLHNWTA